MRWVSYSLSTSVGSIGVSLVSAAGVALAPFAAIDTDVLFGGELSGDFAVVAVFDGAFLGDFAAATEFVVEFSGGVGSASNLWMDWDVAM